MTWRAGRQLKTLTKNSVTSTYTYDADGMRTKKQAGNSVTEYIISGDGIAALKSGSYGVYFMRDENGVPYGLRYTTSEGSSFTDYYYQYNLQGDIVSILDSAGSTVAKYTYDPWGYIVSITDGEGNNIAGNANHIANINPLRYRGYMYDTETGLYYLQSRYYDPATGRFINADAPEMLGANETVLSYNLYAYCENNPVNMVDYTGEIPQWIVTGVIRLAITRRAGLYGWAWYYSAKRTISAAGNAFLAYKGYSLSRAMFNHGMWGCGRTPSSSIKNLMISRLKSSNNMRNAIAGIMKNAKGSSINKNGWVEFDRSNLTNADLYYSLQHVSFNVSGTKSRGVWNLTITVWDTYNFDNIRSFSKLSFGNAANDLGWAMQRIGMMTPYYISVSYRIRW